jgi:hypothetical protein
MGSSEMSSNSDAIQKLKEQIRLLTEQQAETLKAATFAGMTATQAKEYDQGRVLLTTLNKQLEYLEEAEKPTTVLTGTVEKIIEPVIPSESEKAQIAVEQADHLYKEIRIENTLIDADGDAVKLKHGAAVDVVIHADPGDTTKLKDEGT